MPQPVGAASVSPSYYDDAQGVCAEPAASQELASTSNVSSPPVASGLDGDPASAELVKQHDSCAAKKVALVQAGALVVGSAATVALATPTALGVLPSLATFIASSIGLGKAAAELENCLRDEKPKSAGSGL